MNLLLLAESGRELTTGFFNMQEQVDCSNIVRVIVAGNSIITPEIVEDDTKTVRQYYHASVLLDACRHTAMLTSLNRKSTAMTDQSSIQSRPRSLTASYRIFAPVCLWTSCPETKIPQVSLCLSNPCILHSSHLLANTPHFTV